MMNETLPTHRIWLGARPALRWLSFAFAAGAFLLVVLSTGCRERDEHGVLVRRDGTRAILAQADARQITLFGDAPDGRDAEYTNRSAQSVRQHTFTDVGADFDADIDSTGRRIVFASTRHSMRPDLFVKDVDGVAVTQLVSDPADDVQPAWSPDNRRVAFASNRAGDWDIWITNVNGDPPVQVTSGSANDMHPSWSPDGTKLVFCSLPPTSGQWELWITDATAGGSRRFIGYGLFPEWSPGGDLIVYQRARERGSRWFSIWTLQLVQGEPRFPTELVSSAQEAMVHPSWSPDGRRIAYASTAISPSETTRPTRGASTTTHSRSNRAEREPLVFDIWVMGADGRGPTRLTDGHTLNYGPTFGGDGRIYFTTNRGGAENVWSILPGVPASASGTDLSASIDADPVPPGESPETSLKPGEMEPLGLPGGHAAKAAHAAHGSRVSNTETTAHETHESGDAILHARTVKENLSGEPR